METERIIHLLILFHASLGGIALLSGLMALIAKKGKPVHQKAGKVFYYTMLGSAVMAIIIATLPQHESPFLFAVGVFSSYFILTGYRALNYKRDDHRLTLDRLLSWGMAVLGVAMVSYSFLIPTTGKVVLLVFGLVALFFAIRDLRLYHKPRQLKKAWLKLHLGKMIGGYIAATTAFVVVNEFFSSVYGWFVPGIVGAVYIAYWMKKLNKAPVASTPPKAMAGFQK